DVAELRGSAAGFHAVRRPHARLRHGRSLGLVSEALPTKRAYGRSDCHFCPPSPWATLLCLAAGSNLSLAKDRDRYVDVEGRPSGRFAGRICAWLFLLGHLLVASLQSLLWTTTPPSDSPSPWCNPVKTASGPIAWRL